MEILPSINNPVLLCEKCRAVFDHWYAIDEWYKGEQGPKHYSITSLEAFAQVGCQVCALFFSSLSLENAESIHASTAGGESQVCISYKYGNDYTFLNLKFPGADPVAQIIVTSTSSKYSNPHSRSCKFNINHPRP